MNSNKFAAKLFASVLVASSFFAPIARADIGESTPCSRCDSTLVQESDSSYSKDDVASIAKDYLAKKDYAGDVEWGKYDVQEASPGKEWVTFPVKKSDDGSVRFHRVAVDMEKREAVTTQTYIIDPGEGSGKHHAILLADGKLIWEGAVDNEGNVTTDPNSPMNPDYKTRGWCEWAVGALCGTGGGGACYAACGGLGLVNGIAGFGCAAVCGLISAVGCTAATNQICG